MASEMLNTVFVDLNTTDLDLSVNVLGVPHKMKDVLFVVGGSSVYHYNMAIKLLPQIVQKQQTSDALFALIRYAAMATFEITFEDKANFTRDAANIYWTGRGDTLKEALDMVPRVFDENGRPDAERVLVVFASDDDDTLRDDLIKIDVNLKKNGVRVIPVVIGEPTDDSKLTEIHPKKKKPLSIKTGDDPKDGSDIISEIVFKGAYVISRVHFYFFILLLVVRSKAERLVAKDIRAGQCFCFQL